LRGGEVWGEWGEGVKMGMVRQGEKPTRQSDLRVNRHLWRKTRTRPRERFGRGSA